jgi:hypothetical protein
VFKKIFKETPSLSGLTPAALVEAAAVLREKKFHWRVQTLFVFMMLLSLGFAAFIVYDIFVFGLTWWLPLPVIAVSFIVGYLTARVYKFGLEPKKELVVLTRIDRVAVVIFIFYIALRVATTPLLEGYYENIHVVRGVIAATVTGVIAGRFLGVLQMIKKLPKK